MTTSSPPQSGIYDYRGVTQALQLIYRTEGRRGLTRGLLPTLLRDVPFSSFYYMFYRCVRTPPLGFGEANNGCVASHASCVSRELCVTIKGVCVELVLWFWNCFEIASDALCFWSMGQLSQMKGSFEKAW